MHARRTLTPVRRAQRSSSKDMTSSWFASAIAMTSSGANASRLSKSSSKNPPWSPPEKPEIVGLRVEFQETELQRRVK
jgi:hypothetical protein